MLTVLEVTLPVFALVFCGFAGAYFTVLPEKAVEGINAFVFWFALPAMLYRVVALRPIAELIEPRFLLAYACGGLCIFFGTAWVARAGWLDPNRRDAAQSTAYALTAAHGNVGYLGLALVGELGRNLQPIVALVIVADIFILIALSTALLEMQSTSSGHQGLQVVRAVVPRLAKSPLVVSIAAGLLTSMAALTLPPVLENFSRMLANAAGPCALFAIGAALGGQRIAADRAVWGLALIKLAIHPLVAAFFLIVVFRVDPPMAAVGIVCAALPSASNTFIIAQHFGLETRAISAAILGGTFVALATVSFVIWMSGLRI
jgi:malonate transporter and related proteins